MNYTVSLSSWGRFFNVPCSVVDNHLKLSSDAQLKVLLYILSAGQKLSSDEISLATGVAQSAVDDAVVYWCQNGVIKVDEVVATPAFSSEKPLSQKLKPTCEVSAIDTSSRPMSLKPSEMKTYFDSNAELKELALQAEKTLGRELTHYDLNTLFQMYYDFGFPPISIIMLIEFYSSRGKTDKGLAYVRKVAKNLLSQDIVLPSEVECEIIRQGESAKLAGKVAKCFGIQTNLTTAQQKYIEQWGDWGFDIDLIHLAYERCMDAINTLNYKYINSILAGWHDKSVKTVEDAEKEKLAPKNLTAKREKSNDKHSYDLDELEKYAMLNTPKPIKKRS